ncbi:MAG TPA: NAD-dependent epimerase/dehydratase family protein [Rhodoferax sp.]|jgi:2'-hydroxyisoflavone reductase|nr:NAD-dependent epimerase/dehydratase family protein [Rhodoferax sp.]HNV58934.1 NAD-dependent epimerase/dehydratase family protein [Rhodoferax sp.]
MKAPKILVLGGTVFLGRHVVDAALARGCEVTVFNRGQHQVCFARTVEQLRGNRDSDLSALQGRHFDAVIDCSGYTPAQLQRTVEALGDRVGHYVFVSTISVYAGFPPGLVYDETVPVTQSADGYGGSKARAEEVIQAALPGRVTVLRPGLIVGPHDPTGRFTYWPLRMARGGTVLAPGRPDRPVQCIDARDLAAWCVQLALLRKAGVFHGVGPSGTMADLLQACQASTDAETQLVWCDDASLLRAKADPWTGLPLWIPEADPDFGGMLLASDQRAVQAGLTTRPWMDSARDTLAWAVAALGPAGSAATLTPEAEVDILAEAQRSVDKLGSPTS